ncbi:hypothetical protein KI387_031059, partial [Taxus chinensis]
GSWLSFAQNMGIKYKDISINPDSNNKQIIHLPTDGRKLAESQKIAAGHEYLSSVIPQYNGRQGLTSAQSKWATCNIIDISRRIEGYVPPQKNEHVLVCAPYGYALEYGMNTLP